MANRGQPIAHLVPLRPEATDIDAAIDELGAIGVLTKGTGEPLSPTSPVRVRGESIERTISRGREDRL